MFSGQEGAAAKAPHHQATSRVDTMGCIHEHNNISTLTPAQFACRPAVHSSVHGMAPSGVHNKTQDTILD